MSTSQAEYFDKLLANVDEHGWQFTYVFDPDGGDPGFAYSVGFPKSINAPELVVCGLPRKLMSHMLREMYRKLEAGDPIYDGAVWSGLLEGFDCISRKAIRSDLFDEWVLSSVWHWQYCGNEGNPDVYQIVWPGAQDGLFPWDANCPQSVVDAQPALWLSTTEQ